LAEILAVLDGRATTPTLEFALSGVDGSRIDIEGQWPLA